MTDCSDNIFLGLTITNQSDFDKCVGADFYSIEPIQERIDLSKITSKMSIYYPKQIIVGAETGNRKGRAIPKVAWIEEIRQYCQDKGIKLYEKDSLKSIVTRPLIQERI
jgi:protein gp37